MNSLREKAGSLKIPLLWSAGKFRSAFEHVTEICLFPGKSKMSGLEKFRIVRIYELSDVEVKEFCLMIVFVPCT